MTAKPAGRAGKTAAKPSFHGVRQRRWEDPLPVILRFRGGAEGWVYVEARGRAQAFNGNLSILDLLAIINNQYGEGLDGS